MGRPRKYATQAERQAAYLKRHNIDEAARKRKWRAANSSNDIERLRDWKIAHPDHKRDESKRYAKDKQKRREKRMNTPFIAFDGEGINTNIIQTYLRGNSDMNGMPVYRQNYTILTASTGDYIENWEHGLTTKQCLDFLLRFTGDKYLVGFGIGYDVTKMLRGELDTESLRTLWKTGTVHWDEYKISYTPNKILTVTKGDESITLYDTRAFFQKSFIKALEDWKIDVPKEIKEGKKARSSFTVKEKQEIRQYNLMECILLVELMNKMRNAMNTVNVVPHQWYGVGAMAQVIFQDNYIRHHNATPRAMVPKFLAAYYGGRNQVMKLGEFDRDVYLHDINSAYPDAMVDLPSAIGQWSECASRFYKWPYTLYHVEWKLPSKTLITPFPVRKQGNIYYPLQGSGYYWQPEVEAAIKHYSEYIKIKQVWFFQPAEEDVKPFEFYKEYYVQRQEFIKQGNDAQLVLKLALNAGYGKVAQSIGGKLSVNPLTGEVTYTIPAFQNFFWAGMITSKCRAKVFDLAMQSPKDVIAFSTDGVAATKQLAGHSLVKQLGAWEVKAVQNYFIAQTGVYTYKDGDTDKFKSRGFGYKSIDYEKLKEQWRLTGVNTVFYYTENRFIGIGVGLQRNHPELIGCWLDLERKIIFTPQSMRLANDSDNTVKGRKRGDNHAIIQLMPPIDMGESEPYKMKQNWLDSEESREAQDDLDQTR